MTLDFCLFASFLERRTFPYVRGALEGSVVRCRGSEAGWLEVGREWMSGAGSLAFLKDRAGTSVG